ncbi:head GIN domain-containing protein [Tenacibaculum sp. nBUS_03]|uniref:head GIN domain-containing protein n=1 Tax=Tenacibaculum sp. nBUS_03 TaxID=3395320 RepID=UPI003EB8C8E6
MKKTTLLLIAISITLTSQAQSWWSSKKIKGNGNVTTETRKVKNFERVNVNGSFDVKLVEGNEGRISIEGEENIIPYIETIVKNNKLNLKFKKNINIRTTRKLVITVSFESIEGVSLSGSGDVTVHNKIKEDAVSFSIAGSGNIKAIVNANTVKTSIGGSGDIKLKGKTNNLKCSIAGSGDVKAYDLKASNLKASIAGSGNVQTSVSKKIKANVVGSGNIYYKGKPKQIDTNSLGSGDVISRN